MNGGCKSKPKTSNQNRSTKTSKGGAGHSQNSQSVVKSRDPRKLQQYLQQVLHDDKTQKKTKKRRPLQLYTQDKALHSTDALLTYLREAIDLSISDITGEGKTEYLLSVAASSELLAVDFSDSLVEDAGDLLPSVAYRLLADCLLREAQQANCELTSCVIPDVGETLLSKLCDKTRSNGWKAFLAVCGHDELPCVFKHFIRIGVKQFISRSVDFRTKIYFNPGLEFVFLSEHSVGGLALLLRDEVDQAKNRPGSFCTTELGSLFMLNTIIQSVAQPKPHELHNFMMYLVAKFQYLQNDVIVFSRIMTTIISNVSTVIEAVATAFANTLNSNVYFNQQSVLAWMAAVMNSIMQNRSGSLQERCCDAYMFTFSAVLLYTWKLFPVKVKTDLSRYCSKTYFAAHVVGKERKRTGSPSRLTEGQIVDELFFLCQRALGLCLVPALRRSYPPEMRRSTENYEKFRTHFAIQLEHKTLWETGLHYRVAQLYNEQSRLELQLLDTTIAGGCQRAEELQKNKLFWIEEFFTVDMTEWFNRLAFTSNRVYHLLPYISDLENCFHLCLRLLACSDSIGMDRPDVALKLMGTLHALNQTCCHKQKWFTTKIIKGIEQLLPSLLSIYINAHLVGEEAKLDIFMVSRNRSYIIYLLQICWNSQAFNKILRKYNKTRQIEEFLCAFLYEMQTLTRLCESDVSTLVGTTGTNKPMTFGWFHQCVLILRIFRDDCVICPMFWKNPVLSNTESTFCWMVKVLCDPAAPLNYHSLPSPWKTELKYLIGQSLLILLDILKAYLSVVYPDSNILEDNEFLHERNFKGLLKAVKDRKTAFSESQKTAMLADESWMAECLNTPLNEDALFETYNNHLQQARLCTANLMSSPSFMNTDKDITLKPETMALVERDVQHWKRTFLCNPTSAAFLVLDTKRVDVMRCVISGPVGTPYSRGLFVFDIFCPADYPSVPPRVRLVSTVDGTVFFGSYVKSNEISFQYLQLALGYRNTGDWSISKVLHLLKSMMLTAMDNITRDGARITEGRPHLLCRVRAQTVRHAMLEPLKNPPVGLEKVVGLHFAAQQQALLKQCARWVKDCDDEVELKNSVVSLFHKLQNVNGCQPDSVLIVWTRLRKLIENTSGDI